MDFIAIGDTTVDEFIRLKEAQIHRDDQNENCVISLPWGDKVQYDFSVFVPGVGNAANAAVAAARLGLKSGFISNVGKDRHGEDILAVFAREGVDTKKRRRQRGRSYQSPLRFVVRSRTHNSHTARSVSLYSSRRAHTAEVALPFFRRRTF